jgi:hypothetical protein
MKKPIALCVFAAAAVLAQTNTTTTVTAASAAATPSNWFVGTGLGVNLYAANYATSTYVPFVHVGGCFSNGLCEISSVQFGATTATIAQDIGYRVMMNPSKTFSLIGLAGGQLTTTTSPTSALPTSVNLGGIGGGFALDLDPGVFVKSIKGQGFHIQASIKVINTSSAGVQPQVALSFNYDLKR